jgi:hypothetical protein
VQILYWICMALTAYGEKINWLFFAVEVSA